MKTFLKESLKLLFKLKKKIYNLRDLKKFFQVKNLPILIILTSDFEILTELGRKEIQDRGIKAVINWDHLRKQKSKNSQEDNQVS